MESAGRLAKILARNIKHEPDKEKLLAEVTAIIEKCLADIAVASISVEREECAKIAEERAAICQAAYDAGDKTEVHPLNEALHIAHLIRNRSGRHE